MPASASRSVRPLATPFRILVRHRTERRRSTGCAIVLSYARRGSETDRSHAHLGTEQPERDRDAEVEATLPMVFTTLDPPVDAREIAIPSRIRESHTLATAFSIRTSVLRVLRGCGSDHRGLAPSPIRSPMGELGSLTHRQIASRIGVAPFAADSGPQRKAQGIPAHPGRPRPTPHRAR